MKDQDIHQAAAEVVINSPEENKVIKDDIEYVHHARHISDKVQKEIERYGIDMRDMLVTEGIKGVPVEMIAELQIVLVKFWQDNRLGTKVVALSAPQISIPATMFMLKIDKDFEFFTNPVIKPFGRRYTYKGEGCVSFPGVRLNTVRHEWVNIVCVEHPEGATYSGMHALAIQHEMEHMIGSTMFEAKATRLVSDKKCGRNDPCECGSGVKYKNCCGKNAVA